MASGPAGGLLWGDPASAAGCGAGAASRRRLRGARRDPARGAPVRVAPGGGCGAPRGWDRGEGAPLTAGARWGLVSGGPSARGLMGTRWLGGFLAPLGPLRCLLSSAEVWWVYARNATSVWANLTGVQRTGIRK